MSQSYISNIRFHEQRFIGISSIYDSVPIDVSYPGPFDYDISISSQLPNPETSVTDLTVTGVPGSDSNGTIYSGQFRIQRNSSSSSPAISVTGDGLTQSHISTIKNAISLVENPAADGFDDYATISIGLTAIARAGISSFNVTIPFEDSNISIPNNVVQIPFLRFDGSAAGPSFVNPISLNVDNGELSINAGNIASSLPALRISSNWGSNRNITSAILNYDSGAAIGTLEADITENISGKEIIRVSPHGITQLPSSDSSGLTTTANLNARIRFYLWRSTPVSVSGGIGVFDYYHSTLDYRVAYNIECDIIG